jgi:hypothetical protein
MSEEAELVVGDMADVCREIYIRERQLFQSRMHGDDRAYIPGPKWDGTAFPDCYSQESVWPKIARFVLEKSLDPYICIWSRFQLQVSKNIPRPPMPNQIALDKYSDMYDEAVEARGDAIMHQFEFEKSYLVTEMRLLGRSDPKMENREVFETVLLDETIPVSPLLRYCIATQEDFSDIGAWFFASACKQYQRFPELYDEHWAAAKIPKELIEKTRADRALIMQREEICDGE